MFILPWFHSALTTTCYKRKKKTPEINIYIYTYKYIYIVYSTCNIQVESEDWLRFPSANEATFRPISSRALVLWGLIRRQSCNWNWPIGRLHRCNMPGQLRQCHYGAEQIHLLRRVISAQREDRGLNPFIFYEGFYCIISMELLSFCSF